MSELIYKQDAIDAMRQYSHFDDFDTSVIDEEIAIIAIKELPSAEPKIIYCKDCRNRGEDECPMRHVERIEWEEDGYIEVDDIVHDYTEPHGYCDKGERNE